MVRSYNRHGPVEAFGIIAGNSANSIFDGKVAYVPACEDVLVCMSVSHALRSIKSS